MDLLNIYRNLVAIKSATPVDGKTREEQIEPIIAQSPDTQRVLRFLTNRFQLTNISTAKLGKFIKNVKPTKALRSFDELINFLETEVNGTDESIVILQTYLISLGDEELVDFVSALITKSYKCGVSISTFNKLASKHGFEKVPDFKIQLGVPFKDAETKLAEDKAGQFFVTEKFDGIRCIAVIQNGTVTCYSRNGHVIKDMPDVYEDLERLGYEDIVLDGELLVSQTKGQAIDDFGETSSIINSKKKKTGVTYHIFDIIGSSDVFFEQGSTETYYERREHLKRLSGFTERLNWLEVVPYLYFGDDLAEVVHVYDDIIAQGGEGIMINLSDSPYQFKKTKNMVKMKQISENDGVIKGIYEGTGKYKGMLGGIHITYKDRIVNIGGGFTDKQREDYFKNPELIIGKVASYFYTSESTDKKTQEINLRFGRFKGIRFDKEPKDVNYDS